MATSQTPTEKAVATIAPDKTIAQLTAQLKAHPERPVVLYLSGVHESGARCPVCVDFEKEQLATLQKHKDSTLLAKHEIPLTIPAFQEIARNLNANLSNTGQLTDTSTNLNTKVGTPMLLQLGLDAQGKIEIKASRGGAGDLDGWLVGFEQSGRAQTQARDAISPGCNIVGENSCKIDPKAPLITTGSLLKSLSAAQRQ